jgi:hypothetical protein
MAKHESTDSKEKPQYVPLSVEEAYRLGYVQQGSTTLDEQFPSPNLMLWTGEIEFAIENHDKVTQLRGELPPIRVHAKARFEFSKIIAREGSRG